MAGGFPDGLILLEDAHTLAGWMADRKRIPPPDKWVEWMTEAAADAAFESMF